MKISLNWIKEFVDIPKNLTPQALSRLFTLHTAEIEGFEDQAKDFENMVIGKILEILPHPNATKLQITKTDVGKETLQIVCGASNIKVGMLVPVALIGSKVRWHGEGELITLEKAKIRDVESYGMISAAEEIGLGKPGEKSDGILDLSNTNAAAGTPLAEIFGKNDIIFTVDNKSLTHRPDLWGHYGIAREMAAITKNPLKPIQPHVNFPPAITAEPNSAFQVKAKKLCFRYIGVPIDGIKIEPSPDWMQKKLQSIGYRPINNIVDITNYVMAELGQPLHAFDADKIEGGIIVRTAKSNEEITTLDGITRKLDSEMLLIADHKKAIAIAGVMGGNNSEIDATTTRIILEAATFQPSSVRKTSVKLGLRTEAVQRFEKSLDPHLAQQAAYRTIELILQICPSAKVVSAPIDIKNFKDKKITVNVDLKKLTSKIGKNIETTEIKDILERLEFKVELKGKKIRVEVPTFRATKDINIEDDLVEEVARMHGYDNIEPQLPELPIKLPPENRERKLKHFARQILAYGLGFNEVYNYSFYSLKDIQKALIPEELHVKIKNYLSEDQTHLRVSLVPNMLKNIAHNLKNFDQFKLFEVGRTYQDLQEYFPLEEKKICGVIVRNKKLKVTNSPLSQEIFYEAKGALESFLGQFHLAGIGLRKGQTLCTYAHPNKYAEYYFKGHDDTTALARVFELHPLVAKNHDIENTNIAIFEINFTQLAAAQQKETKYTPLPKFPEIEIDISVLMNHDAEIGAIQKTIANIDKNLIHSVELFDFYQGQGIPENKKALACKVILRANDRTLTDEEMKHIQQAIFAALQNMGGEIRGLK